jgi:hypothetical protein
MDILLRFRQKRKRRPGPTLVGFHMGRLAAEVKAMATACGDLAGAAEIAMES